MTRTMISNGGHEARSGRAIGSGASLILGLLFAGMTLSGCSSDDDDPGGVVNPDPGETVDVRQEMRDLVMGLSNWARSSNGGFIVITQNGNELATTNGEPDGPPETAYINTVSGVGQEDLYYGFESDNVATDAAEYEWLEEFLDIFEASDREVLVTNYCSTESLMDDGYGRAAARQYISFSADRRELDRVQVYPTDPYEANQGDIESLADAENFLYLLDPGAFATKQSYLVALAGTDHDILILDAFYDDDLLTTEDVSALKMKSNGGQRLVLAYMSIGEAENYRYYWQDSWDTSAGKPAWLEAFNPNWPNNFKVRYWDAQWKAIVFGNEDSYLGKILDAGFDGTYLDIIDAYEYFEEGF